MKYQISLTQKEGNIILNSAVFEFDEEDAKEMPAWDTAKGAMKQMLEDGLMLNSWTEPGTNS